MAERNEIIYGDRFLRDVSILPGNIQKKLAGLLQLLATDAFDTRLHTKPLARPLHGMYSFRITRDWRVGFAFRAPHVIHLLAALNRRRIYKRMERFA